MSDQTIKAIAEIAGWTISALGVTAFLAFCRWMDHRESAALFAWSKGLPVGDEPSPDDETEFVVGDHKEDRP